MLLALSLLGTTAASAQGPEAELAPDPAPRPEPAPGPEAEVAPGNHAYLGVTLAGKRAVRVFAVADGSAAATAGIEEGDVIVALDGKPVASAAQCADAIRAHRPGDQLRIKVKRDGQELELTASLEAAHAGVPGHPHPAPGRWGDGWTRDWAHDWHRDWNFEWKEGPRVQLGLEVQRLSAGLRRYFKAPDDRGVLVSEVRDGSPAARAGIQPGDVLLSVAGQPVSRHRDLLAAIRDLEPGAHVAVELLRDGNQQKTEVTLEARPSGRFGSIGRDLDSLSPEIQRTVREALEEARRGLDEAREEVKKSLKESREELRKSLKDLHRELEETTLRLRTM
jgi:membrane-associated protease RseP (regulator of RpoE activity)